MSTNILWGTPARLPRRLTSTMLAEFVLIETEGDMPTKVSNRTNWLRRPEDCVVANTGPGWPTGAPDRRVGRSGIEAFVRAATARCPPAPPETPRLVLSSLLLVSFLCACRRCCLCGASRTLNGVRGWGGGDVTSLRLWVCVLAPGIGRGHPRVRLVIPPPLASYSVPPPWLTPSMGA